MAIKTNQSIPVTKPETKIDSDLRPGQEPKALEAINTAIQGIYGVKPGDPDPSFKIRYGRTNKARNQEIGSQ